MARLTGALFSLSASGTIADTLTFAKWKGIQYVRTRVIPANPRSAAQLDVRGIFSTLNELWKRMDVYPRLPFTLAVKGLPLTDRNKHIQVNIPLLQSDANLNHLVMSVASGSALPLDNVVTADGADGTATWTADAPSPLPTGYALAAAIGVAVEDGDPSPVLTRQTYYTYVGATPWAGAIDVPTDGTYQIGVFALYSHVSGASYCSIADRTQVVVSGN